MLRFLIGAACVVVIAAGGLYFYRDRQSAVAAEAAEKHRVVRGECLALLIKAEKESIIPSQESLEKCVNSGALSQSDMDASLDRMRSNK